MEKTREAMILSTTAADMEIFVSLQPFLGKDSEELLQQARIVLAAIPPTRCATDEQHMQRFTDRCKELSKLGKCELAQFLVEKLFGSLEEEGNER